MADQFIGKVLAEKYQIDSLLSEGNPGNLYHGTHLLMEKPVTVKILPSSLATDEKVAQSFSNEARTVSRISHPNILSVTDYGSDKDGTVFIVYEDADGETLKEAIDRAGKFPLSRANRIVKEIASALSFAHASGIVHQNLSSQNVLVDNNFKDVKVLNFGTTTFDINDLDYPIEKIEYLAPEQCTLTGKVDNRTDVYALGIVLYEMLAAEVPFTAHNGTDLLIKHSQEPPPPISNFRPDFPKQVDDILLTALAKNPTIRYQSVNELADALNEVALAYPDRDEEETVVIPRRAANVVAAPEPPQNNIWKTAFIVLAGVSLLGAMFIYMTQGKQTNPTTMQTDSNGMPVQPVNPASGTQEQGLSNMESFDPNIYSNSNTVVTDGGGYETPWDRGYQPPGMPTTGGGSIPYEVNTQIAPPGNIITLSNGSIFMPQDDGYVLVQPHNNNTATNVNTQTVPKKNSNSNVNTQPPANTATKPNPPAANTTPPAEVKPTATPNTKPKVTPTPAPTKPASTTDKRPQSGKSQDTSPF